MLIGPKIVSESESTCLLMCCCARILLRIWILKRKSMRLRCLTRTKEIQVQVNPQPWKLVGQLWGYYSLSAQLSSKVVWGENPKPICCFAFLGEDGIEILKWKNIKMQYFINQKLKYWMAPFLPGYKRHILNIP